MAEDEIAGRVDSIQEARQPGSAGGSGFDQAHPEQRGDTSRIRPTNGTDRELPIRQMLSRPGDEPVIFEHRDRLVVAQGHDGRVVEEVVTEADPAHLGVSPRRTVLRCETAARFI